MNDERTIAAPDTGKPEGAEPGKPGSLAGSVLAGRYRVLHLLGAGGMGEVYAAEHIDIGKRVAIKVLSPRYAHDEVVVERFLREARAASRIEHENVVNITDFGRTPDDSVFFAMESLEGEDLGRALEREGRFGWARAKPILLQVCRALGAAHAAGVIHRDVKPSNCFLTNRQDDPDFVKVVDFGIAKSIGDDATTQGLTQTGVVVGTPAYMSPEQADAKQPLDARTDIYSLGVIMYRMLVGEVPFKRGTFMGTLTAHLLDPVPRPRRVAPEAGISRHVERIILRALEKDRSRRYSTVEAFAAAIEAVDVAQGAGVEHGSQTPGRAGLRVAAALAALGAAAFLGAWITGGLGPSPAAGDTIGDTTDDTTGDGVRAAGAAVTPAPAEVDVESSLDVSLPAASVDEGDEGDEESETGGDVGRNDTEGPTGPDPVAHEAVRPRRSGGGRASKGGKFSASRARRQLLSKTRSAEKKCRAKYAPGQEITLQFKVTVGRSGAIEKADPVDRVSRMQLGRCVRTWAESTELGPSSAGGQFVVVYDRF